MSRIIIQNDSSKGDYKALRMLLNVIGDGRVSNDGKCYCYVSVFPKEKLAIYADVTRKGTDKFIVRDYKNTIRTVEE